ncbi:MAG: GIDE domain-containing protein [Pleurocapsa sp. MO_226.B13]|nr:GIDE domain-containing protein [Pleurocapsa sp. MO_226.B13]
MNIFVLCAGLATIAIAVTFLIKYYFVKLEIRAIKATETSKIGDLKSLRDEIVNELGQTGIWREQVEVKGYVSCDNHLFAQLSQRPCVYCHTVIVEEYEQTEQVTDDEGNVSTSTNSGSKTIADNKIKTNFFLEDETGKIAIDPTRAEIDGLTVVNDFEPNRNKMYGDYRVLGYQKTEKIIALQSYVYILGEINDADDRLKICASPDKHKPFIISYKSEVELLQSKQSILKQKLSWGIGLLILGLMMIIVSL